MRNFGSYRQPGLSFVKTKDRFTREMLYSTSSDRLLREMLENEKNSR
jgi:hypothetical protein